MDRQCIIKICRLNTDKNHDIPLPEYMTPCAAGMDISAAVESDLVIKAGDISLIPTGFAMAIPNGYEAQIRPRSGLAVKNGIGLVNSPGTIDADYRGEIMIPLINWGKKNFTVRRKDRIAQMIIQAVCRVKIETVLCLDDTLRGQGGFGHTG